jgi:hypothetical protein
MIVEEDLSVADQHCANVSPMISIKPTLTPTRSFVALTGSESKILDR